MFVKKNDIFHAMEEHNRQRIVDLLHTGLAPGEIADIVGFSCTTVYTIKKRWNEEGIIARAPGSGASCAVRHDNFLEALRSVTTQPNQ